MDYEFKKLAEVESLSEVPENATVLAEVNGLVKRVPSSGLGGGSNDYDAIITINTVGMYLSPNDITLTKWNFEDLKNKLKDGKTPNIALVTSYTYDGMVWGHYVPASVIYNNDIDTISIMFFTESLITSTDPVVYRECIRVDSNGTITKNSSEM